MQPNAQNLKIWNQIFSEVPAEWTQAPPTEHMQDCLSFFQKHDVEEVWDLGCGIGIWAVFLSKAGLQVSGSDFSPKAIEFAEKWAAQEALEINYECRAITESAFPDKQFDAVLAAKILDNVPRKEAEAAIPHIQKSLRNGGVVYALFNPFLTDDQIAELEQSDNPTKGLISENYTDAGLQELFSDFSLLEFKHYDDGFRGLLLSVKKS